ncbi:hypothetical protein BX600DRAFT_512523 [Xylariales sp. PMI_506]|nr:hypothetical protein BX600DRAFT_512523 [Xylariales sp. PMI_506]
MIVDKRDKPAAAGQYQQQFYIFGHNISHSLSPALHNAGFQEISFHGRYTIHESPEVDHSVEAIIAQPDFGGASVTFPHKLHVHRLLDEITPAAQAMGAINTIIAENEPPQPPPLPRQRQQQQQQQDGGKTRTHRRLVGDNTDWQGIRTCIQRAWVPEMAGSPALVWGAGGAARAACFALRSLGVREVRIVNRTRASAEAMAAQFPDLQCSIFATLHESITGVRAQQQQENSPVRIVVACVPADDVDESQIPEDLISAPSSAVLVEMAYRPPVTTLMQAAGRYPEKWTVFNGMDVLQEQGFAQFKLWTGQDAPKAVMLASMRKELERRRLMAEK